MGITDITLVFIGLLAHILVQMQKFLRQGRAGEFSWKVYFRQNAIPIALTVLSAIAFLFIAAEQLQLDQVPPGTRNSFMLIGGYTAHSLLDKLTRTGPKNPSA